MWVCQRGANDEEIQAFDETTSYRATDGIDRGSDVLCKSMHESSMISAILTRLVPILNLSCIFLRKPDQQPLEAYA